MSSLRTLDPVTAHPEAWTERAVLRQRWAELAYFHWRYPIETVQQLLPFGVTVDAFDGSAWVGLIPFEMRNVRVGPGPVLPYVGNFIEVNVRTYVTDARGRRAVWFFSLDVPRSAVVAVARTMFALPYCWARAGHIQQGDRHHYGIRRRWPGGTPAEAQMSFRVGEPMSAESRTQLDNFLSARWGLLTTRGRRVLHGRVHHEPWPLHAVHDVEIDQTVIEAAGLPSPHGEPHAMYSPGVDVQVSRLRRVPEVVR